MASSYELNTTTVFMSYRPEEYLLLARFLWPIAQPESTYTIAVDNSLSIKLDERVAVRPAALSLITDYTESSTPALQKLFGTEFAEKILATRNLGIFLLRHTQSPEQSIAIARLQAASPSTPFLLKQSCRLKLQYYD